MTRSSSSFLSLLPAFILLLSLALSESPSFLWMAVGAILWHEAGHFLFFLLLTGEPPALGADGFGLRLCASRPLLVYEEWLVASAGPLFNTVAALLLWRTGNAWAFSFGTVHFLLAAFNLFPLHMSDGERLLRLMLPPLIGTRMTACVLALLRIGGTSFFFFFSVYLYYLTGIGLCGVFYALLTFPKELLFPSDDLRENERKTEILRGNAR